MGDARTRERFGRDGNEGPATKNDHERRKDASAPLPRAFTHPSHPIPILRPYANANAILRPHPIPFHRTGSGASCCPGSLSSRRGAVASTEMGRTGNGDGERESGWERGMGNGKGMGKRRVGKGKEGANVKRQNANATRRDEGRKKGREMK